MIGVIIILMSLMKLLFSGFSEVLNLGQQWFMVIFSIRLISIWIQSIFSIFLVVCMMLFLECVFYFGVILFLLWCGFGVLLVQGGKYLVYYYVGLFEVVGWVVQCGQCWVVEMFVDFWVFVEQVQQWMLFFYCDVVDVVDQVMGVFVVDVGVEVYYYGFVYYQVVGYVDVVVYCGRVDFQVFQYVV